MPVLKSKGKRIGGQSDSAMITAKNTPTLADLEMGSNELFAALLPKSASAAKERARASQELPARLPGPGIAGTSNRDQRERLFGWLLHCSSLLLLTAASILSCLVSHGQHTMKFVKRREFKKLFLLYFGPLMWIAIAMRYRDAKYYNTWGDHFEIFSWFWLLLLWWFFALWCIWLSIKRFEYRFLLEPWVLCGFPLFFFISCYTNDNILSIVAFGLPLSKWLLLKLPWQEGTHTKLFIMARNRVSEGVSLLTEIDDNETVIESSRRLASREMWLQFNGFDGDLCSAEKCFNALRSFYRKGVDFNFPYERTLLHDMCANNLHKCIWGLLRNGADPNIQRNDGTTPMHAAILRPMYAAIFSHPGKYDLGTSHTIKMMLCHEPRVDRPSIGADFSITDHEGRTPYMLDIPKECPETLEALRPKPSWDEVERVLSHDWLSPETLCSALLDLIAQSSPRGAQMLWHLRLFDCLRQLESQNPKHEAELSRRRSVVLKRLLRRLRLLDMLFCEKEGDEDELSRRRALVFHRFLKPTLLRSVQEPKIDDNLKEMLSFVFNQSAGPPHQMKFPHSSYHTEFPAAIKRCNGYLLAMFVYLFFVYTVWIALVQSHPGTNQPLFRFFRNFIIAFNPITMWFFSWFIVDGEHKVDFPRSAYKSEFDIVIEKWVNSLKYLSNQRAIYFINQLCKRSNKFYSDSVLQDYEGAIHAAMKRWKDEVEAHYEKILNRLKMNGTGCPIIVEHMKDSIRFLYGNEDLNHLTIDDPKLATLMNFHIGGNKIRYRFAGLVTILISLSISLYLSRFSEIFPEETRYFFTFFCMNLVMVPSAVFFRCWIEHDFGMAAFTRSAFNAEFDAAMNKCQRFLDELHRRLLDHLRENIANPAYRADSVSLMEIYNSSLDDGIKECKEFIEELYEKQLNRLRRETARSDYKADFDALMKECDESIKDLFGKELDRLMANDPQMDALMAIDKKHSRLPEKELHHGRFTEPPQWALHKDLVGAVRGLHRVGVLQSAEMFCDLIQQGRHPRFLPTANPELFAGGPASLDFWMALVLLWSIGIQTRIESKFNEDMRAVAGRAFSRAPGVKAFPRSLEKALEYVKEKKLNGWDEQVFAGLHVIDGLRCSFVVDTAEENLAVGQRLEEGFPVVRTKNWHTRDNRYYADRKYNLVYTTTVEGIGTVAFLCEVQILMRRYLEIKKIQHALYEVKRSNT